MTLYPDVQRRARAELDSVISPGSRLPDFDDRANLPFLDALEKEVYRWNPISPMGTGRFHVEAVLF